MVFKIDYVVEQLGNREFGSVFLNEKENVALAVVSNGWAKVSTGCFLTIKLIQALVASNILVMSCISRMTTDLCVVTCL